MKNLFIIAMLVLALFAISCGSPIRPIYQVVAEEEAKVQIDQKKNELKKEFEKRKQQLVEQKGGTLTIDESDKLKDEFKKEEDSEIRKIQTETMQKIASYGNETDKIIKELLKKKPSEMTEEEFQTYLLIEQKSIAEQHADNVRKWQTFDVLFRTIPYLAGITLTIIFLAAD